MQLCLSRIGVHNLQVRANTIILLLPIYCVQHLLILSLKLKYRYALHEALLIISEEGLEATWDRHASAAKLLYESTGSLGLECFVNEPQATGSKYCSSAPLASISCVISSFYSTRKAIA